MDKNLLLEPYVHNIYDSTPMPGGIHSCSFTENTMEQKKAAKEFILNGLNANNKVLYILSSSTKDQIISLLQTAVTDPNSYLKSGQLQIVSYDEAYLVDGNFFPETIESFLQELLEQSEREGYSAFRVLGEMDWAAKNPVDLNDLLRWEVKVNKMFETYPNFLGHCQYTTKHFSPLFLNQILEVHPVCQIGQDLYPNQYYIPPEDFLSPAREKKIFKKRILQIKKRKKTEEQIAVFYKYTQDLREFSHMVAHDLNEPIRTAHLLSDIIKTEHEKKLPPELQAMLKLVRESLKEGMNRLESLKDLNNLSRDVYMENIDINTAIASIIDSHTEALNKISANIIFIKSDVPLTMRGSIKHLNQLFNNIINNSIKYRRKNTPLTIQISSRKIPSKKIEISIKDNGIGFKPEFSKRIFLPFKRLHLNDEYEGTGIGLTICQRIMARYNGEILAEGKEKEGAIFKIIFPEQEDERILQY